MGKEMMYGEAMAVAITEEMQRDADVVFYGQNMAMTERDPMLVDQAPRHSSAAAVIAAEVAEKGFEHLRAPVIMVTALDASVPYSEPLEEYLLPNENKIAGAVRSVLTEHAVHVPSR